MKLLTTAFLLLCLLKFVVAQDYYTKAERQGMNKADLSTMPIADGKINYTEIVQLDSTFKKTICISMQKSFL